MPKIPPTIPKPPPINNVIVPNERVEFNQPPISTIGTSSGHTPGAIGALKNNPENRFMSSKSPMAMLPEYIIIIIPKIIAMIEPIIATYLLFNPTNCITPESMKTRYKIENA